ncbi:MAG: hypothetical protein ACI8W9_001828, partial [Psychromonas sp.]
FYAPQAAAIGAEAHPTSYRIVVLNSASWRSNKRAIKFHYL